MAGIMQQFKSKPPSWAMKVFRFICHPDFQEEIEGDLLENYQADIKKYGKNIALRRFYIELLSVLRPNLIFNLNTAAMIKYRNWLFLLLAAFLVVIASVAPFLPGPKNSFSYSISKFAQTTGYLGLFFLPFGLTWLIIEICNKKGQKLNRWTNGYYPAWLTISPFVVLITIQLIVAIWEGPRKEMLRFIPIYLFVAVSIYFIQKLKQKSEYHFNKTPIYVILIPLVALFSSQVVVEKLASLTRESAIKKTEPLIAAIEKFKSEHGQYPDKIEDLEGVYISAIPTFAIMSTSFYRYERMGDMYTLSFERSWHWNATEVVMYNCFAQKNMKNNFKTFATSHANWRYWMAD